MVRLHSYVVRYDSGFAPNPFYGFCTLAACKPKIRRYAKVNDWVVGSGSNAYPIRRGGHIVYAMRVTETKSFLEYDADPRFQRKKPYRQGSRKQSCGDNIYFQTTENDGWLQRDSFHSGPDGENHTEHTKIDTSVDRVLISDDFIYFGGGGPVFPSELRSKEGRHICKTGIGHSCFEDQQMVSNFVKWIRSFRVSGYQNAPFEWVFLRG